MTPSGNIGANGVAIFESVCYTFITGSTVKLAVVWCFVCVLILNQFSLYFSFH